MIVCGILVIVGINGNMIIYGIPNGITSPSSLQSVVKKPIEATFMSIAEFVSDKGERGKLARTEKEIAFWDGEQVQ